MDVVVKRETLSELDEDENYWIDLIGCAVINNEDIYLGHVQHILATGANDVLVIKGEKEYLVPYILNDYILNIDVHSKKIRVNWDHQF